MCCVLYLKIVISEDNGTEDEFSGQLTYIQTEDGPETVTAEVAAAFFNMSTQMCAGWDLRKKQMCVGRVSVNLSRFIPPL